jgi:hypothetical protein
MKQLHIATLALAFLFLAQSTLAQAPNPSAIKNRIIRAEKPFATGETEDRPALRVVGLYIGDEPINLNREFSTDNNWLLDLRVRVKNISRSRLYCVGVSFGLLAEIETKLETHESWPWGLGMYKGECGLTGWGTHAQSKFRLEPSEETEPTYDDVPEIYRKSIDKMGKLAKAVFHRNAVIGFQRKKATESPLAFPNDTKFPDDAPY